MGHFQLLCQQCGCKAEQGRRCTACNGVLETRFEQPDEAASNAAAHLPGLWKYAPLLPVADAANGLTLGEGSTPLVRSERIAAALGLKNLWFKMESANPTGSYKDRIAAVALTRARELGQTSWIGTSSGNGGAAVAAYGARAGLPGLICTAPGAAPAKLAQAQAYGAGILKVEGFGSSPAADRQVFETLLAASEKYQQALFITAHAFDPWGMDGAKTIAYEIAGVLQQAPDHVFVPAGGGGLATAVARGFRDWKQIKRVDSLPRMTVVQAEGCSPLVSSWRKGGGLEPIEQIATSISGVQLTDPPDGNALLKILREDNGAAMALADEATYEAQWRLATEEGIFVEPASALTLAAVVQAVEQGQVAPDEHIVCILTGSGFKDQIAVERLAERQPPQQIPLEGLTRWLEERQR